MKTRVIKILIMLAAVLLLATGCIKEDLSGMNPVDVKHFSNPLWEGADPYVLYMDGYYYFTHADGHNKVYISRSTTLLDRGEMKLIYEFPAGKWNSSLNWGPPALFKWDDGNWYMYYCAADGPDMNTNNINHRLGVLRATTGDPMGPYEDLTRDAPLNSGDTWAIAAQAFQDPNGRWYTVWSGVEEKNSFFPQDTFIAPMENPWTLGQRVKISTPDQYWEKSVKPIQEGQTVIRRGNKLLMLYNADASWTDSYCLGMLTYEGGDILNPASWKKHPEPVFKSTTKVVGPGGAAITKSPDGKEDWLFYHAGQWSGSGWRRYVNAQKFTWDENDIPVFGDPVAYGKAMPLPSGDKGIPKARAYECNWKSTQLHDWTTFGGEWTVEGGGTGREYTLKSNGEYAKSIVRSVIYDNFTLECRMSTPNGTEGSDAGVIFRVTAPYIGKYGFEGYYAGLDVSKGEVKLVRVSGNETVLLASKPVSLEKYTSYRIRIEARGDELKLFLNDMEDCLVSAKDSTYVEGCIGVRAYKQSAKWKGLSGRALN